MKTMARVVGAGLVGLVVTAGSVGAKSDQATPANTYNWTAVLTGVDAASGHVTFRAGASYKALQSAERLMGSQEVLLYWDGPSKREGHRISAIESVTATKKGFRFPAKLESVDPATGTLVFSIPVTAAVIETLDLSEGQWVQTVSAIDDKGRGTEVVAIGQLRPQTARR